MARLLILVVLNASALLMLIAGALIAAQQVADAFAHLYDLQLVKGFLYGLQEGHIILTTLAIWLPLVIISALRLPRESPREGDWSHISNWAPLEIYGPLVWSAFLLVFGLAMVLTLSSVLREIMGESVALLCSAGAAAVIVIAALKTIRK